MEIIPDKAKGLIVRSGLVYHLDDTTIVGVQTVDQIAIKNNLRSAEDLTKRYDSLMIIINSDLKIIKTIKKHDPISDLKNLIEDLILSVDTYAIAHEKNLRGDNAVKEFGQVQKIKENIFKKLDFLKKTI